jgi:quercetin dioxygenase-like cupin family protein
MTSERQIVTVGDVVSPGPEYSEEESGPVGQAIIHEDEHCRVWDIVLPPGGYFPLHTHEADYLIIAVKGARCKTWEEQADGTWVEKHFDFQDGDVVPVFVNGGQTHRLFSADDKPFVNRLVEFKR